jgi:membrane-bound serine protease (ClpP class)
MVDEDVEVPGIDEKGKLLTLSTTEAVRIGWAREVADWDAMLAAVNAPGARVVTAEINWAERLVRFLSTPFIASLLLTIGFLGIIIELKTPHFGLAGLAGVLSLGAFFGSHMLVGLAGWETVLLLAGGVVLLLVEMFILPGFGVAGVLGVAAVVGSILLAMLSAFPTGGDIAIALAVLSTSLVLVLFTLWALIRHLPNDRRGRALLLHTSTSRDAGFVAGRQRTDLEGMEGVVLTDLRPAGTAQFGDEPVDVVSEGGWVKAGTRVRILRSEHYRHIVRPVAALEETAPFPQPSEQAGD